MRKVKLIGCLSILPAVAITPAFVSSCSKTKTYTIANFGAVTYVPVAANVTTPINVTLCNNIYVTNSDNEVQSIDIDKSTKEVTGSKSSLISDLKFVKNAQNNDISVLGDVTNWDGSTISEGDIILKLELVLDDGTPIDCKTNIILKHDYWISPREPWIIKSTDTSQQFSLMEGMIPATTTSDITWKVVTAPEGYENNFNFSTETNGLLEFKGASTIPNNQEMTISATVDEYVVESTIWLIDGTK